MTEEVLFALDVRGVATITLNRPAVLNAIDAALVSGFNDAMAQAVDRKARVIVLEGTGSVFCSGADINYLRWAGSLSRDENLADARQYAAMAEAVRAAPQPVVARVQGGAYGGGVALAAACDIVIAGDSASFAITEARYGFTPSLMVPYLLGRIGQRGCRRWCLTGETMPAAEALRIGMVDCIVADEALEGETAKLVDGLLMNAPVALAESKDSIGENAQFPIDAAHREQSLAAFVDGRGSAQAAEGSAAFLEKRPPNWVPEGTG